MILKNDLEIELNTCQFTTFESNISKMKNIVLLLFLGLSASIHAQNTKGVFVFGSDTLQYNRHSKDLLPSLEKAKPNLHRAVYWLDIALDKCQESINKGINADLIGEYSLNEQIRDLNNALTGDCKKFAGKINIDSYRSELAFYEKCNDLISNANTLKKERERLAASDSIRIAKTEAQQRAEKEAFVASASQGTKEDSIHNLRATFPHKLGTTFGGEDYIEVSGLLDAFLQTSDGMNLNPTGVKELGNGQRTVYENKMGTKRLLYTDFYYSMDRRPKVNKLTVSGDFELVVKLYIDYWYNNLRLADFSKLGEITSYHNTDEIKLTADVRKGTATIAITRAPIN